MNNITVGVRLLIVAMLFMGSQAIVGWLNLNAAFDIEHHIKNELDAAETLRVDTAAITADVNYVSRLTRSIMLGDNLEKNLSALDERRSRIEKRFQNMAANIQALASQSNASALPALLEESRKTTLSFVDDGIQRMRALGPGPHTLEQRDAAWQAYHKNATPVANAARDAFARMDEQVQNIYKEVQQDTGHQLNNLWKTTLAVSGAAMLVGLAVLVWISRSIVLPLRRLRDEMAEIERNNNIAYQPHIEGKDEIAMTAHSLGSMLRRFGSLMKGVQDTGLAVHNAASELDQQADVGLERARAQEDETTRVATAMTEMVSTVNEVAANAASAAQAAADAQTLSQSARKDADELTEHLQHLAEGMEMASQRVNRLKSDSHDIGRVVDVIRGIAEQTNLLALNAAIEAARAGEQGRGFAVVAEEVRNLASKTQASTQEIQAMIERLRHSADETAQGIEERRDTTRSQSEQAQQVSNAMQGVVQAIVTISDMNLHIASAAEEQAAVAEEINRNIVRISELTTQATEGAQRLRHRAQTLGQRSHEMEQRIGEFRLA